MLSQRNRLRKLLRTTSKLRLAVGPWQQWASSLPGSGSVFRTFFDWTEHNSISSDCPRWVSPWGLECTLTATTATSETVCSPSCIWCRAGGNLLIGRWSRCKTDREIGWIYRSQTSSDPKVWYEPRPTLTSALGKPHTHPAYIGVCACVSVCIPYSSMCAIRSSLSSPLSFYLSWQTYRLPVVSVPVRGQHRRLFCHL